LSIECIISMSMLEVPGRDSTTWNSHQLIEILIDLEFDWKYLDKESTNIIDIQVGSLAENF